jgi:hypothetical protein
VVNARGNKRSLKKPISLAAFATFVDGEAYYSHPLREQWKAKISFKFTMLSGAVQALDYYLYDLFPNYLS